MEIIKKAKTLNLPSKFSGPIGYPLLKGAVCSVENLDSMRFFPCVTQRPLRLVFVFLNHRVALGTQGGSFSREHHRSISGGSKLRPIHAGMGLRVAQNLRFCRAILGAVERIRRFPDTLYFYYARNVSFGRPSGCCKRKCDR
jgi:hypothetical protein